MSPSSGRWLLRRFASFVASCMVVVTVACLLSSQPGLADGAVEWSAPVNVSQSGRAGIPLMAISADGVVHVVWGEPRGSATARTADTIMYSWLAPDGWSRPIDILAAPYGDIAVPEALEYDRYGQLVLVWRTNNELRLSVASAESAGRASGWLTSVIEANRASLSAALAVADDGAYHLAFVRGNREIVYMASTDGGGAWQPETIIERVTTPGLAVSVPCITVNNRGGRFVAWATNTEATNWAAAGVWFSNSIDDGKTWLAPRVVSDAPGHGAPSLLYDADGRLHLAWVGNLGAGGRYLAVSHDDGASFGPAVTLATPQQLRGYAGAVQLLQDSAGSLHALFGAIGLGQLDSIWYVAESGGVWSAPAKISMELRDSQGAAAGCVDGRWLHAVWIEYSGRDVWHAVADPETAAVKRPTPERPSGGHQGRGSQSPVASSASSQVGALGTPALDRQDGMAGELAGTSAASPVAWGVLSAAAMLVGLMVIRITWKHR